MVLETNDELYEYDGLNRRTKKHVDSQAPANPDGVDTYVHMYYNSGWQMLETRSSAAENTEPETLDYKYQYVWSARYIDSPVLRREYLGEEGGYEQTERLYYTTDANMNVTALVNVSGEALERYLYDAYGRVTVLDADWSADADGAKRALGTG